MKHVKLLFVPVIIISMVWALGTSLDARVITKTFAAKELVKISVASSDVTVTTGKSNEITVKVDYTYQDDEYEPVFNDEGNQLVLKENFIKKNNLKGESNWSLILPEKTTLECNSASGDIKITGLTNSVYASLASGDLELANLKGKLEFKTASGDIQLKNAEGDMTLKAASGDIDIHHATGALEISAASGDIKAYKITLTGKSKFHVASGDVDILFAGSPAYDYSVASASGDLSISYNGNELKGSFEVKGMKDNVSCPAGFTEKSERHNPFAKWYFSNGDSPKVEIKAVSGDITIKK